MRNSDSLKIAGKFLKSQREKKEFTVEEVCIALRLEKEIIFDIETGNFGKFKSYLFRRYENEPMAYILGYKHFWKHKFLTNKSVLIPRPDTELVIEETLKYLQIEKSKKILDVGTGSGCIVVSLLKERPKCIATAIDISKNAIKVAKTNAKLHQLENKINFINIDIDKYKSYNYDLIISNPPYIKFSEVNGLDRDVRCYEPKIALSGGIDGLSKIRLVVNKSSNLISSS